MQLEEHRIVKQDLTNRLTQACKQVELFRKRQSFQIKTRKLTTGEPAECISAIGSRGRFTPLVGADDTTEAYTPADVEFVTIARSDLISAETNVSRKKQDFERMRAQFEAACKAREDAASPGAKQDRVAGVNRATKNLALAKASKKTCTQELEAARAHLHGLEQRFTFLVDDPHAGPREGVPMVPTDRRKARR